MKSDQLKPYSAYSRCAGPCEGAVLVFAHTVQEARIIAWNTSWLSDMCDDEWIDLAASKLESNLWIMKQATSEEPHVIESPVTCEGCLMWGYDLDENGICESCREERE